MKSAASETDRDALGALTRIMPVIEGVVRLLGPLNSDERRRAIDGALVILGEPSSDPQASSGKTDVSGARLGISPRAQVWMKQNGISPEQLGEVFDINDGNVVVIASEISGKNNADKTIKSYVLTGLTEFLASGEPNISDKSARNLCEMLGHYDSTNHSKHMREKGNYLVGDKDKGWKLTAPGLKYGATVVKEIAGGGG